MTPARRGFVLLVSSSVAVVGLAVPAITPAQAAVSGVRAGSQATSVSPGSSHTYVYTSPSGVQVGDLEVVALGLQGENEGLGAAPVGWTALPAATSGASDDYAARTRVYAHTKAAGDPATATWTKAAGTSGGSGYFSLPVTSFAVQGAALPSVSSATVTTAGTPSGTSVTPASVSGVSGGLLVEVAFSRSSSYGDPVAMRSASMTQSGQLDDGTSKTLAAFTTALTADGSAGARPVSTVDDAGRAATAHTSAVLVALVPATTPPPATLSGLPWLSGIQSDLRTPAEVAQWRGRANDIVDTWPNRSTWAEVVDPRPSLARYADYPARLSIGTPMLPNDEASSFGACAAGSYDDKMRTFATNLRSSTYPGGNRGDSIVRLAWEFNTPADSSSSLGHSRSEPRGDNAGWIGCWRRWYTVVNSVAPGVVFNWNPNSDTSSVAVPADSRTGDAAGDVTALYPGDAYVDVIGIDHYNRWPAVSNETQWNERYDGRDYESSRSPRGVGAWLAFARSHGKKLSFPEWAITYSNPAGAGGADDAGNAYWVRRMVKFFADNKADIDHEIYFDFSSGFGCQFVIYPMPSGCANTQAASAYAAAY